MILQILEDDAVFKPNIGQQQLFVDDWDSEYVALCGGWYSGKTYAGARKFLTLHVYNAFDGSEKPQPTGVAGQVVGQDYQLAQTVNIPELKDAMGEMGLSYRFMADRTKFWFELLDLGTKKKPSLIYIRSADAPEKINGYTVGHGWGDEVARWACCPEEPHRDPLIQFRGRIRDPRARIKQGIFTYTNEGDTTQVYRDFEESPKEKHKLYRVSTFDNPHAVDFGNSVKPHLTAELADQYIDGKVVSFRGSHIYGSFDERVNVSDSPLLLATELPLHLSMDFNINPGMHGVIGQQFFDHDILTAVKEFHGKSMSAIQMMAAFRTFVVQTGGWRWPSMHLFGDPSGNGRFEATGETSWQIVLSWLAANMPDVIIQKYVRSQAPAIADRVNSVNCAFQTLDKRVRYRIDPSCKGLINDYKKLKWDGNEIDKKDRKLSHFSDGEGYRIERLMPVRAAQRYEMFVGGD